jgi:hypothetical protein
MRPAKQRRQGRAGEAPRRSRAGAAAAEASPSRPEVPECRHGRACGPRAAASETLWRPAAPAGAGHAPPAAAALHPRRRRRPGGGGRAQVRRRGAAAAGAPRIVTGGGAGSTGPGPPPSRRRAALAERRRPAPGAARWRSRTAFAGWVGCRRRGRWRRGSRGPPCVRRRRRVVGARPAGPVREAWRIGRSAGSRSAWVRRCPQIVAPSRSQRSPRRSAMMPATGAGRRRGCGLATLTTAAAGVRRVGVEGARVMCRKTWRFADGEGQCLGRPSHSYLSRH